MKIFARYVFPTLLVVAAYLMVLGWPHVQAQPGPGGTMLAPEKVFLLRDGVGGMTTVRVYEIPAGRLYVTDRGGIAICTPSMHAGC